jgi:hypothetical protein
LVILALQDKVRFRIFYLKKENYNACRLILKYLILLILLEFILFVKFLFYKFIILRYFTCKNLLKS